jgi:hypothetical protein
MTLVVPLDKKTLLEELLNNSKVQIHINPKFKDIDIPPEYRNDNVLMLNLSYNFAYKPILSEWGIETTLTFGTQSYACKLPWGCIFMILPVDRKIPYLSIEDVPDRIIQQVEQEEINPPLTNTEPQEKPIKKSPFQVIKGGKKD